MASPHLALLRWNDAHTDLIAALEIAVELGDSASILAIREQLAELEALMRARGETPPEPPLELRPWLQSSQEGGR